MMVEAGVKILPEDVMAEAIMFAHRSIAPLIDLQEQLREKVGKPKRLPYLEPATDSVLTFAEQAPRPAASSSIVDVETTGTDPKMADLVEVAAVRVKGGKITDRWSTFVNPGRPIVGNQMHGITDKDVKGAPTPAEAARKALDFVGDAPIVGHSVGFDIAFLEAALGDGTRIEQGRYLDTLVIAREGYPDARELQAAAPSPRFFGVELKQSHRALPGRRGHRRPADLVRQRPARPDRGAQGRASPTAVRATRKRQGRVRRSCSRRPAARRASARACSGSCRRRPSASSSSARASAWTAAPPTRSARSRSRSACSRARTAPACSPAARPRP